MATAFVLPDGVVLAQEVECCQEMLLPVGARAVSLGQALTTRGGNEAMFYNPAGIIDIPDEEFLILRSSSGGANLTTFGVFVRSELAGVFGLTYSFQDHGDEEQRDEANNLIGTLNVVGQALLATFATSLSGGWSAGVNYRLWDFRSRCDGACGPDAVFSGTTHMVDAGIRYQPAGSKLVLGASLMHAGFPLQIRNKAQADVSPARLRVGAGYEVAGLLVSDTTTTTWVYVDAVQHARSIGDIAVNVGVEIGLDDTIFLRAGRAGGEGFYEGGTGIGVGFKYQRFEVSAARSLTSSPIFDDEPFHISFSMTF